MKPSSISRAIITLAIFALPICLSARGLGELQNVSDSTMITMTHDMTVIAQAWRGSVFVCDETGYGVIDFGIGPSVPDYAYGDVIPAGFHAIKVTHNDEPLLISPTGVQDVVEIGQTVPIEEISCSLLNHTYWAHLCVIRNAKINLLLNSVGTIQDASGKSCILNNEFNITLPKDDERHDVYGVVASVPHLQNTNWYEFWPVSIDVLPHGRTHVAGINELMELPEGTTATFLTPLTAVWQHGSYLIVMDHYGTFGLVVGDVEGSFENGDSISDAQAYWQRGNSDMHYSDYMIPVSSTFVPSGHGTPVEPQYMTVKQYKRKYAPYAGFKDVKFFAPPSGYIIPEPTPYTMGDGTDYMDFFNVFDIPFDIVTEKSLDDYIGFFGEYDYSDFDWFMDMLARGKCEKQGQLYDVEGYSLFDSFAPIKITPTRTYKYHIGDLDGDGETTVSDVEIFGDFLRRWWGGW